MGFFAKRLSAVKIVSAVMALVMLLNVVPNIAGDLLAWAATGDIRLEYLTRINKGTHYSPFITYNAGNRLNEIAVAMDIGRNPTLGVVGDLSFWSDKGDGTTPVRTQLSYEVMSSTADNSKIARIYLKKFNTAGTEILPTSNADLKIYADKGAGFTKKDVTYDVYIDPANALNDPTGNPQHVEEIRPVLNAAPYFDIPLGTTLDAGYSFVYLGEQFHVMWKNLDQYGANNPRLYFMSDQFIDGRIYDFAFTHDGNTNKRQGLTGLVGNKNKLTITPWGNMTIDGPPATNFTNAKKTGNDYVDVPTDIDILSLGNYVGGSGRDDTRIDIEFNLPKTYDAGAGAFTYAETKNVITDNVTLTLEMDENYSDKVKCQIKMEKITTNPTARSLTPTTIGVYAANPFSVDQTTGKLTLRLANMPPSTIYGAPVLNFDTTGATSFAPALTSISETDNPIYTFMKYRMRYSIATDTYDLLLTTYKTGKNDDKYTLINDLGGRVVAWSNGTGQEISFATPIKSDGQERRLYFDFNNILNSQKIRYTHKNAPPDFGTPTEFHVYKPNDPQTDRYPKVTPPETDPNATYGTLSFWTRWDVGKKSAVEDKLRANPSATLTYRLNVYEEPKIGGTLAPFSQRNNGDNGFVYVTVTPDPTDPTKNPPSVTITGPKVKGGTYTSKLELRSDNINFSERTDVYYISVPFEADAVEVTAPGDRDFDFPGIYFMNVDRVEKQNVGGVDVYAPIASSLLDNMTINGFAGGQVPPPQDLRIENEINAPNTAPALEVGLDLPAAKLRDYYATGYPYPVKDIGLNVYITQNENALKTAIEGTKTDPKAMHASSKPYSNTLNAKLDLDMTSAISNLRAGDILRVPYMLTATEVDNVVSGSALLIPELFRLTGLDKNQKYYFAADIVTNQYLTGSAVPAVEGYSYPSNVMAHTTKGDQEIPDPAEKVPPTPTIGTENVGQSNATLWWNRINPASSTEYIEYEIIRLTDKQLDKTLLDSRVDFETFFTKAMPEGSKPIGFRTSGPDLETTQDGSTFSAADPKLYTYNSGADPLKLIDNTLLPNKVYFYYVRTVRVLPSAVPGEPAKRVVSTWAGTSVTTTPVNSPENLKVETARKDYDPKTEIYISFDAPITDISQLGNGFDLQYQLKADGEDWQEPVTMKPAQLVSSPSAKKDYTHFLYKITGLKPGTMYSIRVRMLDANGSASMYTNTVTFKTDISQQDYDNEKKKDDWLNLLQKLLEDVLKKPYWQLSSTANEAEFFMRPGMFNNYISQARDGSLTLPVGTGSKNVYYLPLSVLVAANEANKGFRMVGNGVDVYISPNAINESNPALVALSAHIKRKEISDTMVKLTIITDNRNESVDGSDPLSPFVTIGLDAMGLTTTAKAWDDRILQELTQRLAVKLADTTMQTQLTNAIKAQTINEDLVQLVEKFSESIIKELLSSAAGQLSSVTRYTQPITSVDRSIIIASKNLDGDASVSVYRFEAGMWTPFDAQQFGSGMAMYIISPGTYVLAGSKISIPDIEKVQGAGTIVGIVAKYGLDDFFGKDGTFNLEDNAMRYQVAGSVARMAGAPRNADSYEWIKSNMGLTVSSRNANRGIQRQEAIYLAMALYESRTGTKISTIKIRNYTQLNNIKNIDANYKKSIQAAYELGFISDKEFSAQSSVTVKEIVELFKKMDDKLGLR